MMYTCTYCNTLCTVVCPGSQLVQTVAISTAFHVSLNHLNKYSLSVIDVLQGLIKKHAILYTVLCVKQHSMVCSTR